MLIVAVALVMLTCTGVDRVDKSKLNDRAREVWLGNMAIIDRSVEFWKKKQPGTAPYTPEDLTRAIDFFETITRIRGANLSFLGPIPDGDLEKVKNEWKAWYAGHGDRLIYDATSRRVLVTK